MHVTSALRELRAVITTDRTRADDSELFHALGFVAFSVRRLLFFKVEQPDAAPVGLRDRDDIAVDARLLALLRQVPEQMRDVAADRADIRAFEFEAGEIVDFVKTERALDDKFILVDFAKFLLLDIELVLDVADDFLEHVVERNDADSAAVFVDDD